MFKNLRQIFVQNFFNTQRWSEFEGYSILPGMKIYFEVKTPEFIPLKNKSAKQG